MDAARWTRIQELYHAAEELRADERARYVRAACGADAALAAEVLELLAQDEAGDSLLDRDLPSVAHDLFNGPGEHAWSPLDFAPYRIRSVLGEGGMGVVYLAERSDLGSLAALKVLRDAWLSPARRERFAAEQRTLAQLRHPAIAQLHDAGTLPSGVPWFAMEYVEGVPLTEYCRAHETSIEGRLELFRAVCEAVQYAHAQAVIHRDLKPSNILVERDGTVKLLDFGIAKHLEGAEQKVDPTVTGLRLMTPAYASPEQLRGEPVGIHTDIYSLGVILYELLARRAPFDTASRARADNTAAGLGPVPPRPSTVAGDQPRRPRARGGGSIAWADLDVLCLTAMQEEASRRYPTVEALIRDVDHFLAGEPLEARPDTLSYRLGKFLRRHRKAAAAAAGALALVLVLVVFYTLRLTHARQDAEDEAGRVARIQSFMLSLFAGGDEAGPAEDLRVLTLLDRGVQEAHALDGEPVVQAELFRTLGSLFQELGEFDRAEQLLEDALELQGRVFAEGHAQLAETRIALGLLRMNQARYDEAEQFVRRGLAELGARVGRDHPSVATATTALGQVLEARGEYDQAIAVDEEAVRLCSRNGEDTSEYVAALGQLADSHYYAGHYETADELNHRVLAHTRRIYGERHPRVADVLINLGASLGDRGRYDEAETYYRQALERIEAFYGADHYRTASAKTMLGRALVYQKQLDEGVPLLERALGIQERVHGPVHPRVASALNDLGSAALQRDRYDEAEAYFRRMLAIYSAVYPEGHYLLGIATSNVASVLTEKRDYAGAEELYRRALAIYEATLSPTHLNTGIGRIKLGRVLLRQGKFAAAEEETLAGYEILSGQADPAVSWLRSARSDLVDVYTGLGRPEQAVRFRSELEGAEASAR